MKRSLSGASRVLGRCAAQRPALTSDRTPRLHPGCYRVFNSSSNPHDYPKEGVFQKNSPRSNPLTRANQKNIRPQPVGQPPVQPQQPEHEQPSVFQQPPYDAPPPQAQRPSRWRFLRAGLFALYMTSMTAIGFLVILELGTELLPLPFEPGSEEDREALALLAEDFDSLPMVQELRNTYLQDKETGALTKQWQEWPAYKALSDPTSPIASRQRRQSSLGAGTLRGSRAFAAQYVFHDPTHNMAIVIINFGEAVTGWPGNVHGGAIATCFDESFARVAGRALDQKALVTANMNIDYIDPVKPGQWHALLIAPARNDVLPEQLEGLKNEKSYSSMNAFNEAYMQIARENRAAAEHRARAISQGEEPAAPTPRRKVWVHGTMFCLDETGPTFREFTEGTAATSGRIHLHATGSALFVAPKEDKFQEGELQVGSVEF